MPLVDVWSWLESQPMSAYIAASWWFPFLESIHVLTGTFVVGSILMVDLRLLGLAARRHPVSRIVQEVVPWTLGACAVSILAGLGLFVTRAGHYAENPAFLVKMALLVLAGVNMIVFHFATARNIERWDTTTVTNRSSRLAGVSSLLLWAGVMLAGRWIGHLS